MNEFSPFVNCHYHEKNILPLLQVEISTPQMSGLLKAIFITSNICMQTPVRLLASNTKSRFSNCHKKCLNTF